MLTCRETTSLISQSLDAKLSLRQRIAVRIHLFMCRFCSRFKKQLYFIRDATEWFNIDDNEGEDIQRLDESLTPESREKLKRIIAEKRNER